MISGNVLTLTAGDYNTKQLFWRRWRPEAGVAVCFQNIPTFFGDGCRPNILYFGLSKDLSLIIRTYTFSDLLSYHNRVLLGWCPWSCFDRLARWLIEIEWVTICGWCILFVTVVMINKGVTRYCTIYIFFMLLHVSYITLASLYLFLPLCML